MSGREYAVDTGFMVSQDRTYPNLIHMLQMLDIPARICYSLGRMTDLRLFHFEDITAHYAETLAVWRQRFRGNLDQMRNLRFSDDFMRTCDFYFCHCEGGFRERAIGDAQVLLAKPACRLAPILSPLSP